MDSDFERLCNLWDDAQKAGIFPKTPKAEPEPADDLTQYYTQEVVEEILNEDHSGPAMKRADIADMTRDQAKLPNPVLYHTLGNDQDLIPWTPNFSDGKELEDLIELKKNLYELECELNTKDTFNQNTKGVQKKIEEMKKRLYTLSNSLTPDRFKEVLD